MSAAHNGVAKTTSRTCRTFLTALSMCGSVAPHWKGRKGREQSDMRAPQLHCAPTHIEQQGTHRMEHRQLGGSGLKVPVLSLGTGTFGGGGEFFAAWGNTNNEAARRLVDICLDAGLNMFDSADVYSSGLAEQTLG